MEFPPPLNHPLFGANVPAVVFILLLAVLHGLLHAVALLLEVLTGFPLSLSVPLRCCLAVNWLLVANP